MDWVALIPGVLALVWCFYRSPDRAALDIHLPTLLLLPGFCRWQFQGLPDLTFCQAAILPIAAVYLLRRRSEWQLTRTDLWIVLFVAGGAYSESLHRPTPDAVATLFDLLTCALLPYMVGKGMIEARGLRYEMARRTVFLLAIVSALSVYEFRMGSNPFVQFWMLLFPAEQNEWVTQIRWGFGRVAGPYSHAILAGLIFGSGLILNHWLNRDGAWRPRFQFAVPIPPGALVNLILGVGLLMTMSRGPWLGALCGVLVAAIGSRSNIRRRTLWLGIVVVGIGLTAFAATMAMTAGGWRFQDPNEVETAAYRRALVSNYMPLVEEGGFWGWGRVEPPRVPGQPSIDNNYLLVALTQGYFGLFLLILILAESAWTLWRSGLRATNSPDRRCAFALLGCLVGIAISTASVYLGAQSFQLFFIIVGWAQGLRLQPALVPEQREFPSAIRAFPFPKVLA